MTCGAASSAPAGNDGIDNAAATVTIAADRIRIEPLMDILETLAFLF